ncbi:protein tyrosine phosphatase family protein [Shimia ponticola]|uniref:protein tyrosine phosphatase family protein n=1 Tax=Shimia ponticola TaxID=2582893 RepID=UPI0011BF2F58|nr:protein tyrosine phosphatase family protein [Shimia ponticola]
MDAPEDILNWRQVDDRLSLSGQPTKAQCSGLAASGVAFVINLAPQENKGALKDEGDVFAELGVGYRYIPVDFENPTEDDYAAFCAAMDEAQGLRTHIHCIYNARVTAFMLRYAQDGLGGDVKDALGRMDGIWRPGGAWAQFIGDTSRIDKHNEYAGYEYAAS